MTDTTTETVEPVVDVAAEPVVETPVPEPEPQPEPVVTEHGNKGKQPWFLGRISEETSKRTAAEERATAAERRAAEAEALAQRMQRGDQQPPIAPAQPQVIPPQDLDRLVDQRANEKRFFEETSAVKNAGLQKFGAQFENDLNILTAVGATSNEMVADILAVDKSNAHVLLNQLANDPEKAAVLAKMDTRTRIAELTRLTMASAQPVPIAPAAPKAAPKGVSRAPAPPPPVEPSASKVVDWRSDDVSDQDFSRGWEENAAKRAKRR